MIRTWLTLWNSVVFAIALVAIGATVYLSTRNNLYGAVDHDLEVRSDFLVRGWPYPHPPDDFGGPHGPGGPGGPPPEFNHGGAGGPDGPLGGSRDHHAGPPHGPRGPGGFGGDMGPPEVPRSYLRQLQTLDPVEAERLEFSTRINHPRIFNRDGTHRGPPGETSFDPSELQVAFAGRASFETVDFEDHPLRVRTVPLREHGEVTAAAQFASDLEGPNQALGRLRGTLVALIPIALIATALLGMWLTGRALTPVKRIADAADAIGGANLQQRLPIRGADEFAYLATRFNRMFERIEQSFEAQRRFISDASHELKSPLTVIKGRAGLALGTPATPERYQDHLRAIDKAADGMSAIVRDLLLLAQADEQKLTLRHSEVQVCSLASESIASVSNPSRIEIQVHAPADLTVNADADLLKRALGNLLSNAIRHSPGAAPIAVTAERLSRGVEIAVADGGGGIPKENLNSVFDRFHRLDEARDRSSGGTGLGLAIVKSIVEAHGGQVGIESDLGVGTTVRILLPDR